LTSRAAEQEIFGARSSTLSMTEFDREAPDALLDTGHSALKTVWQVSARRWTTPLALTATAICVTATVETTQRLTVRIERPRPSRFGHGGLWC